MDNLKKMWVEIGKKNPWIRVANDPRFDINQVHEKKTISDLHDHFVHGNWCLGDAPFYKNICFINQDDGGGEYLVIRDDIPFESITVKYFPLEKLTDFINRVLNATEKQLRELEY